MALQMLPPLAFSISNFHSSGIGISGGPSFCAYALGLCYHSMSVYSFLLIVRPHCTRSRDRFAMSDGVPFIGSTLQYRSAVKQDIRLYHRTCMGPIYMEPRSARTLSLCDPRLSPMTQHSTIVPSNQQAIVDTTYMRVARKLMQQRWSKSRTHVFTRPLSRP